jgi:hypothetical protein
MSNRERNQLKEIARELGRIETRVRRAGLAGDKVKSAKVRGEVATFARSLLAEDFGPLG